MSLVNISKLTFFKPDLKKFPGLKLGWDALQSPCCSPVVLNASNEIAVDCFLKNKIKNYMCNKFNRYSNRHN